MAAPERTQSESFFTASMDIDEGVAAAATTRLSRKTQTAEETKRYQDMAFFSSLIVNLVDSLGITFTNPVLIPYGMWLGMDIAGIAWSSTVRGWCSLGAKIWMPYLSDRASRRVVVLLSVIGSTISYLIMGLAYKFHHPNSRMACFIVGRGVNGMFDGTAPVLRSYVAQVYEDEIEMKQKLIYLNLSSLAIGMAFSPLAGVIASVGGLASPYFCCFVIGLCGTGSTFLYFKERIPRLNLYEEDVGEDGVASEAAAEAEAEAGTSSVDVSGVSRTRTSTSSSGSRMQDLRRRVEAGPWLDITILLAAGYQVLAYLAVSGGLTFLLPLMLYQPTFGIGPEDPELSDKRAANIAFWTGIVQIPMGLCNCLVSVMLYVRVTKTCGEGKALLLVGLAGTCVAVFYALWVERLWQLCILQALMGCCLGIIAPAASPLMAEYGRMQYPRKMATVQAIPALGKALAAMFGHNVVQIIIDWKAPDPSGDKDLDTAWYCMAGFLFLAAIMISIVARRVRSFKEAQGRARGDLRSPTSEQDAADDELPTPHGRQSLVLATSFMHLSPMDNFLDCGPLPRRRWNNRVRARVRAIGVLSRGLSPALRRGAAPLPSLGESASEAEAAAAAADGPAPRLDRPPLEEQAPSPSDSRAVPLVAADELQLPQDRIP